MTFKYQIHTVLLKEAMVLWWMSIFWFGMGNIPGSYLETQKSKEINKDYWDYIKRTEEATEKILIGQSWDNLSTNR